MLSRTPSIFRGLLIAALLLPNLPARADEVSTADSSQSWASKNLHAYYLNWLQGMHTEALSGNRDGSGTNLEDDHFFAIGPSLAKNTKVMFSVWAAQVIDEDDSTRQFQPQDPYITLSQNQILHSDRFAANMDGYLRLYIPLSLNTVNALNKGTVKDYGHGMMRLYLAPSKSWIDGKLTFTGNLFWNVLFNSMSQDERFRRSTAQNALDGKTVPNSQRQDMYVILDPILDYQATPKWDFYLEWSSGPLRHFTSGTITDSGGTHAVQSRWTSTGTIADGDYLSPGINWSPTKKIAVNPYLSYQLSSVNDPNPVKRRLNLFSADIGLQVQYTFN